MYTQVQSSEDGLIWGKPIKMPLKLKRQDKGLTPTSIDQASSIHGLIPRYFCFLDTCLDSRSIDRVIKSQTIKVWECFLFWGGGGGAEFVR